jgi:hypothetical protein
VRPSPSVATLACLIACAHPSAGGAGRTPHPQRPAVMAIDTVRLRVPETVTGLWVFEVHPAKPEAERQVGHFSRPVFLSRVAELHRQACSRGLRLVVGGEAAGDAQVSDEITFDGMSLGRSRLFYQGHVWEGAEIPC